MRFRFLVIMSVALIVAGCMPPSIPDGRMPTPESESLSPELIDDLPNLSDPLLDSFPNDYAKIWEPNSIRGSSHAVAASPTKDLIAVAGGYLNDAELHIYRWNPEVRQYVHVWDSGNGVIKGDVLDVAFMDADNNGFLEVVAGSADGKLYVFEALAAEEIDYPPAYLTMDRRNLFFLVWNSSDAIDRQIWSIAASDIDHDSQGEILVGCWDGKMYLFDYIDHTAWPYCSTHEMDFRLVWNSGDTITDLVNSVAVGDTDGDGRTELLAGSEDGKVYIFEEKPCFKHTYLLRWDSGDTIYRPVNSIAVSNNLDADTYGEIVVSAYGQGVFVFEYNPSTQSYDGRKLNRSVEAWEMGALPSTGVYTGYELDPYIDNKTWGWESQGIFEPDSIPYPWSVLEIGGSSALGGPRDDIATAFNATENYALVDIWEFDWGVDEGQFRYPADLAFDSRGYVYVTDLLNNRVQKLDQYGMVVQVWGHQGTGLGEFYRPYGIAVDAKDNVYVADTGNSRIQKFTSEGQFVESWGSFGAGPGQLNVPVGLAFDIEGRLYVADQNNSRVQVLDCTSGEFVRSIGVIGSDPGELYLPSDVAVSPEGDLYVADSGNDRVEVFTVDGDFVDMWGGSGTEPGKFQRPYGITTDAAGHIYVSDLLSGSIQKFDSTGTLIAVWGEDLAAYAGLLVSSTGLVYIADTLNNRIKLFGLQEFMLLEVIGSQGAGEGQFNWPFDLACDDEGYIYVSDTLNQRVVKLTPEGHVVTSWKLPTESPGEYGYPQGIEVQGNRVYVINYITLTVQVFNRSGSFLNEFGGSGTGNGEFSGNAQDITSDGTYLYVSDVWAGEIEVFDMEGNWVRVFGTYGSGLGELGMPFGLDIGPDGILYVVEWANRRVQKFYTDGTPIGYWPVPMTTPVAIQIDSFGSLYISDPNAAFVQKTTPDGLEIARLEGRMGDYSSPTDIVGPGGMMIDADGVLWIADCRVQCLYKVKPYYSLINLAEAVVDFGAWEEIGGDGTPFRELQLYFQHTRPTLDRLHFAISQDLKSFVTIPQSSTGQSTVPGWELTVFVDLDPALKEAQWKKARYLRIGVEGGVVYSIDAVCAQVAKPIDTALVVTTGNLNHSDDSNSFEEIIIGTIDGQLLAYNSTGMPLWESQSDVPRFSLTSSCRDIIQLDDRGYMPTWKHDGILLTDNDIPGGVSFERFDSYCLVDIDDTSALDLVATVVTPDHLDPRVLYFRNKGTDDAPSWEPQRDYFATHANPPVDTVYSWPGIHAMYAAISFGDLDNDGDKDFVLTSRSQDGNVSLAYYSQTDDYYWTQDWSQFYEIQGIVATSEFLPKLSFADMDKDGDLDMTLAAKDPFFKACLYYFEGSPEDHQLHWTMHPGFYESLNRQIGNEDVIDKVGFHDYDHDGDIDLTVAHAYENYTGDCAKPSRSRLSYFENVGTLPMPEWVRRRAVYDPDFTGTPLTESRGYVGPEMHDMNGDGVLDLTVMQNNTIECYYAVIDHNCFMVATYPYIHLVEVEKRGSYSGYSGYEAYDSWSNCRDFWKWSQAIAVGDTDRDKKVEVIVGSFDSNIYTFEQVANNTYRRAWRSTDLLQIYAFPYIGVYLRWNDVEDLIVGDLDKDGNQEIVTLASSEVFIFENRANDTYETVWVSGFLLDDGGIPKMGQGSIGASPISMTVLATPSDLDLDGQMELVAGAEGFLMVFEKSVFGTYYLAWYYKLPQFDLTWPAAKYIVVKDIVVDDVDQDGAADFTVVGCDEARNEQGDVLGGRGWIRVWEAVRLSGTEFANNTYDIVYASLTQGAAHSATIGDNDNDMHREIYVGVSHGVSIYENVVGSNFDLITTLRTEDCVARVLVTNTDRDSYEEVIAGSGKYIYVFEQNSTYDPSDHKYDIVWTSQELGDNVTDIAMGDSNANGLVEMLVSAAAGHVYSFEWVQHVTAPAGTSLALSAVATSSPDYGSGGSSFVTVTTGATDRLPKEMRMKRTEDT